MKTSSTLRQDHTHLLVCKCGDISHQCYISYDNDYNEVSLAIHLVREPSIFKRFIIALKYVFGQRSIYGDFDEIILSPADASKLQDVVNHLKAQE